MAVKFQLRGTQRDAYYATAWAKCVLPRQTDSNVAVAANVNTGVFGSSVIKVTGVTNPLPQYIGLDNLPTGVAPISILMRLVPNFTGLPSAALGPFEFGSAASPGNVHGGLSFKISTNGKLSIFGSQKNSATTTFNSVEFNAVIPFTTNVPVDIWFTWDGTTGANKAKLWVATDGATATNVASLTATSAITWDKFYTPAIMLSAQAWGVNNNALDINELVIWDTEENPAAYGTRTTWITTTASAFEGYNYSDPGVANVRSGTAYTYGGLAKTGTAAIPTAANVRSGTATDATTGTLAVPSAANVRSGTAVDATTGTAAIPSAANVRSGTATDATTGTLAVPAAGSVLTGVSVDAGTGTYVPVSTGNAKVGTAFGAASALTGTYDGSDRWTDPGESNVRAATAYKANSATNNKTGTMVAAAAATTKVGTTADDGTGTYDGSDRWTDPAIANVRSGTAYKANSTSNNRTGTMVAAAAATTKTGVTADDGTGTYTGSDRWTDPGEDNVKLGVAYKADSTSDNMTGTLESTNPGEDNVRTGTEYKIESESFVGSLASEAVAYNFGAAKLRGVRNGDE